VAGGLWYLHFRSVDSLSDEEAHEGGPARDQADLNGEHRTMWVAVQKVWAAIKPKEDPCWQPSRLGFAAGSSSPRAPELDRLVRAGGEEGAAAGEKPTQ
jgi:hypothetical protein